MLILMCELQIEMLFIAFVMVLVEVWQDMSTSFNPGQDSIYGQYIVDAIDNYISEAEDTWSGDLDPQDVDPWEYVDEVFSAFDEDVMARAFSDTIFMPVDQMYAIQEKAAGVQERMEMLEELLGG